MSPGVISLPENLPGTVGKFRSLDIATTDNRFFVPWWILTSSSSSSSLLASPDRMVRLEYYLQYTPEPKSEPEAIANVRSLIGTTNVPFGAP
jgi:hypothetical protein